MNITSKEIKNLAVIGHSGEGKTTLCEAMLFNGGAIERMGKTTEGNTVCDFDEQEIQRKISISLAVATFNYRGMKINLLDVPGFFDFEGEFNAAMRAAGSALLVMGANGTLTVGARKAIDYCLKNSKPMVIFINGMDKDNADYAGTVAALKEEYHGKIAPIQIPIMEGNKMVGYVNAIKDEAYRFTGVGPEKVDIPKDMTGALAEMKASLMETAAENDDALLDKYFEVGELTTEEIIHGIRKGIASVGTIPVMAGSALKNKGVINLMQEIVKYMPRAYDRKELSATDERGKQVGVSCLDEAPMSGFVFKTFMDPFVGKLNYIRVASGVLKAGDTVYNSTTKSLEKINSLYLIKGKKTYPVNELTAGDIGAAAKLVATGTGDTLCDVDHKVTFDKIFFPKPCLSMAVYAEKKGEEDKIFAALSRLAEEDLSFTVEKNKETGEMILSGQGETQLEIIAKKIKAKFNVGVLLQEPKIAYRETIKKTVNAEGKHKKQSGGHGQYGHVKMRFEPCESEFEFAEEVVGGAVPGQYIPAVEKGMRECIRSGVLGGYPVTGLRAVLTDGSYHDVDSSEMAFKMAAELAFKDGMKNAEPALLEPIRKLRISVPDAFVGDVLGDLNKRRGKIQGMDVENGATVISAEAPETELLKYATALRSMTQGRGRFVSSFARYEEVPAALVQKIIK